MLKGLQCVKMGLLAPIASEDSAVSASMVGQGWTVALTSMIVQGRLVSMVLLVLTEWVAFIVGVRLEKLVSVTYSDCTVNQKIKVKKQNKSKGVGTVNLTP